MTWGFMQIIHAGTFYRIGNLGLCEGGGGRESRIGEGGEGICKGKVGEGGGDVMLRMDGGFGRWIGRVLFIWQGRSGRMLFRCKLEHW